MSSTRFVLSHENWNFSSFSIHSFDDRYTPNRYQDRYDTRRPGSGYYDRSDYNQNEYRGNGYDNRDPIYFNSIRGGGTTGGSSGTGVGSGGYDAGAYDGNIHCEIIHAQNSRWTKFVFQIEWRTEDTATAGARDTAIGQAIVIATMETITTADIQTIESIMIAIKAIAAVESAASAVAATRTIATSDHGTKAIGMCPISIFSIG